MEWVSKPSRAGVWNSGSSQLSDMAAMQSKEGLLWVSIEGKHFITRELREFARVPGDEFLNFENLAALISNDKGSINFVYGARLRTPKKLFTVFADGSTKVERWELDQSFIYPEWTRN
jgi:hypothetical protein